MFKMLLSNTCITVDPFLQLTCAVAWTITITRISIEEDRTTFRDGSKLLQCGNERRKKNIARNPFLTIEVLVDGGGSVYVASFQGASPITNGEMA